MKKISCIVLTLVLMLVTAGCGQDKLSNGKTPLAQINESKELKIGLDPSVPIYAFLDKDGTLSGFDIDVMEEVAKRMGVKTKYYYSNWDSLFAGLSSQRFDVATGHIEITKDRQKTYDFSKAYKDTETVIVEKDGQKKALNLGNLKNTAITLPITSYYASLARNYKMYIIQGETFADGMQNLENGKSKYMIFDRDVIQRYLVDKQINDINVGYTFPEKQQVGLMFRKGNSDLVNTINEKLNEMESDGTMNKIKAKWFR
ncbi:transporter substrate-binding domain-containing protein [Ectobacillus polymachus]|uniref:ABC transporter substrate-binding protein n=1 Tax=Ectobacillus polymachus TaxID=1508806 RepID=UPI003A8AA991